MSENRIQSLMAETMEKIKSMVDVDTIVGKPIYAPDGTMIVPVSKISFGFGSGGTDFVGKNANEKTPLCFGGGGGAGVTVSPVCFLVVSPTEGTRVVGINAQASTTADRLVEMIPDAVGKISGFVSKMKDGDAEDSDADNGTNQS